MSKGLGEMQRNIIKVGRAKKLLFDCVKSATLESSTYPVNAEFKDKETGEVSDRMAASDAFIKACNRIRLNTYSEGAKWEWKYSKSKPFKGLQDSKDGFDEIFIRKVAKSSADVIAAVNEGWDLDMKATVEMAPCLWALDDIYCRLFPKLYTEDAKKYRQTDTGYRLTDTAAVKKKKASAKASITRALSGLLDRGYIARAVVWEYKERTSDEWEAVAKKRQWKKRPFYNQHKATGSFVMYAILDELALAK